MLYWLYDVKECFWYELHALTYNGWYSIGCQTRIPIGAYLPNPGLSVAGPTTLLMIGTSQLGVGVQNITSLLYVVSTLEQSTARTESESPYSPTEPFLCNIDYVIISYLWFCNMYSIIAFYFYYSVPPRILDGSSSSDMVQTEGSNVRLVIYCYQ